MERKYQIIYIWSFIIISGIVLLLLYTPLGGNLHYAAYSEESRYNVAPGVNYQTQVGGFSAGSSSGSTNSAAPQAYVSESFRNGSVGGGFSSMGSTSNSSSSYGASAATSINTSRSSNGASSGGLGGGGMLAVGSRGSKSASGSVGGGGLGGGSVPFSSNSGTVMQKATTAGEDALDPGGDENLGNALGAPLTDELLVLMVLISIFAFYKWLLFRKK